MTLAALTGYLAVPLFGALMAQGRRSPGRLPTDQTRRPHRRETQDARRSRRQSNPGITPCKSAKAGTRAILLASLVVPNLALKLRHE